MSSEKAVHESATHSLLIHNGRDGCYHLHVDAAAIAQAAADATLIHTSTLDSSNHLQQSLKQYATMQSLQQLQSISSFQVSVKCRLDMDYLV